MDTTSTHSDTQYPDDIINGPHAAIVNLILDAKIPQKLGLKELRTFDSGVELVLDTDKKPKTRNDVDLVVIELSTEVLIIDKDYYDITVKSIKSNESPQMGVNGISLDYILRQISIALGVDLTK